jgi:hypothetical protein
VSDVLVASDDPVFNDYGSVPTNKRGEVIVGGMRFLRWPYVRQKTDYVNTSNPAVIIFSENPGNTTDRFYLLSYKNPVDILSLSIQGEIGSPNDYGILLVLAGKYIEGVQSGNYEEAYRTEVTMKRMMSKVLNGGIQGACDDRPVGREF